MNVLEESATRLAGRRRGGVSRGSLSFEGTGIETGLSEQGLFRQGEKDRVVIYPNGILTMFQTFYYDLSKLCHLVEKWYKVTLEGPKHKT